MISPLNFGGGERGKGEEFSSGKGEDFLEGRVRIF